MNAVQALNAARASGVGIAIDGDKLVLRAVMPLSPAVIDLLAHCKPEIMALLRPAEDGWSAATWLAFFVKRAGIAEFSGGVSRKEAEARAFDSCVVKWLDRHPAPSPPGRCAWCGGAEMPGAVIVPFGTEPNHHTWLHAECWPAWRDSREAEAVAALAAMGVRNPGSCQ